MISYFDSFKILSENELNELENHLICRTLNKNDFLIKEGQICNEIVFIRSGVLRSFYINHDGNEITNCLTFENELMSAFSSFITQQATDQNIQAVVDTELLVLKKNDLELLYESNLAWQKMGKYLTELQYVEMEKRVVSFQKQTAKERYQMLFKHHPNYIKYIPLTYLASYWV